MRAGLFFRIPRRAMGASYIAIRSLTIPITRRLIDLDWQQIQLFPRCWKVYLLFLSLIWLILWNQDKKSRRTRPTRFL